MIEPPDGYWEIKALFSDWKDAKPFAFTKKNLRIAYRPYFSTWALADLRIMEYIKNFDPEKEGDLKDIWELATHLYDDSYMV